MLYKTTKRLFNGTYQYKIVLVCAVASSFRSKDLDAVAKSLKKLSLDPNRRSSYTSWRGDYVTTQDEIDYAFKLHATLSTLKDLSVRVESPWLSIYTNSKNDVDAIIAVDNARVKYVCVPPTSNVLDRGVIIMPKIDFEFRVTLGKTAQDYSAFVNWAENNSKVKLTKSCKKELSKPKSWGGTFFYITGEKNLLLAKMHLGGSINKVERIIKA
jgi:hypothetical protein